MAVEAVNGAPLERKSTFDRAQHSDTIDLPSILTSTRASRMPLIVQPTTLQSQSGPLTAPKLSPPDPPSSYGQLPNLIPKSESTKDIFVPHEAKSETSSICRDPGWDNGESRERRKAKQEDKDKRRRQKETAAIEAKRARPYNRLTKAPPTGIALPRPLTDRSESTSAVLMSSEKARTSDKPKSRSKSVDIGFKSFMSRRSTNSTPVDDIQQQESKGGFVGGLKLQQEAQNDVQNTIQKQKSPPEAPYKSKFAEGFPVAVEHDEDSSSLHGGTFPFIPSSIQTSSPAYDQQSSSSRKARTAEDSQQGSEVYPQISAGDTKRARNSKTPTIQTTTEQTAASLRHVTPAEAVSSQSPPLIFQTENSSPQRYSKQPTSSSFDRPPVSYRGPTQLAKAEQYDRPRRGSFDFLRVRRQSSKDRSATRCQDEFQSVASSDTSSLRHSRNTSWSFNQSSRTSSSRLMTENSMKLDDSKDKETNSVFHLANQGQPTPDTEAVRSFKETLLSNREFSRPNPLHSLKHATKAVFSRRSYSSPRSMLPDPTNSLTPEVDPPSSINHLSSNYLLQSARQLSSMQDQIVPQVAYTNDIHNLQDILVDRGRTGESNGNQQSTQNGDQNSNDGHWRSQQIDIGSGSSSKSSSLNESSDEYHSVLDESTNLSTPAPSRSPSKQRELKRRQGSGQIGEGRANWELGDRKSNEVLAGTTPNEGMFRPIEARALGRSRSTSASELQDLSFLPTLKHQPLARPSKNNRKEKSLRYNSSTTVTQPRPPTPLHSSSSSASSALVSPTSSNSHSQYLQNARQNLPPSASTSRPSLHSTSGQESNTLAKMLVICCHCHYFHDLPSKIYECMTKPDNVVRDSDLGVSGLISTTVKCPWCGHGMSTRCCEGWAAVVVLKERLH